MSNTYMSITVQELQDRGEAALKTGPFGTQLHASDYVSEGTPVINVRNIGFGKIRENGLEFIADETVHRLSGHLLEPGDIVFGRKGAVERHAYITKKYVNWFQGSDCLRLRIKSPLLETKYLSYYFLTEAHKQWMINQSSHGATMASLNQAIISRISLRLPKRETQQEVVSILSAYDDLIENNTRRIRILEEMAQSLYREWFVHFRFPGHEKVKMINSPLGKIPKDWEVKTVGGLCDHISRGVTPQYEVGSTRFIINQKANTGGEIILANLKELTTDFCVPKDKFAQMGDLLVNCLGEGTIGRVHLFLFPDNEWAVDQHMSICRSEKLANIVYLYHVMASPEGQAKIQSLKSGGTNMTTFNMSTLKAFDVILPSEEFLDRFYEIAWEFFQLKGSLQRKNTTLRHTRDLLLPRLISGEIYQ